MHKKLFYIATAAILGLGISTSSVQAQDQPSAPPAERRPMMDPEQQIQRMQKQLNLSDDQMSQIRPILADAQKQSMDVRSDTSLAQPDRRAKMMAIHQDSMAKVKSVLTADQRVKFDQMMDKQRQRMQERMQDRQNSAPPNQ